MVDVWLVVVSPGSVVIPGQRPQELVLCLQLLVPLLEVSDLVLQKLYLFVHRQLQVTLHQVHGLFDLIVDGWNTGSTCVLLTEDGLVHI